MSPVALADLRTLRPCPATTRADCPTAITVPGTGVGVKVGVGTTRVGTEVGKDGVSVASGPAPGASTIGVTVDRGMGVGRGTKLPQARLTSASISKGRLARRRPAERFPGPRGSGSACWKCARLFMGWTNHGPSSQAWVAADLLPLPSPQARAAEYTTISEC